MLISHAHMRSMVPKYCNKGAREFFRRHNLDWKAFITTGIPEEQLRATGDAMVLPVIEQAYKEWAARTRQ